ncbi:MAG: hypothetical protein AB7U29_10225 [Desulfobulbus sp.]
MKILLRKKIALRTVLIGLGFVAATLITGCSQANSWTKPGITEVGFDSDMSVCRRQASMAPHAMQSGDNGGLERSDMHDRLIRRCMEAKGYRLVQ